LKVQIVGKRKNIDEKKKEKRERKFMLKS